MNSWILPSFLSLMLYGLWGFLGAKASQFTNAKTVFIISCTGSMIIAILMGTFASTRFELSPHGLFFGLLTGLSTGLGTFMFMNALQRGPAIPIVMITALYPMVTVLLTFLFLKQGITTKQIFGVMFSMIAIYFLTFP